MTSRCSIPASTSFGHRKVNGIRRFAVSAVPGLRSGDIVAVDTNPLPALASSSMNPDRYKTGAFPRIASSSSRAATAVPQSCLPAPVNVPVCSKRAPSDRQVTTSTINTAELPKRNWLRAMTYPAARAAIANDGAMYRETRRSTPKTSFSAIIVDNGRSIIRTNVNACLTSRLSCWLSVHRRRRIAPQARLPLEAVR